MSPEEIAALTKDERAVLRRTLDAMDRADRQAAFRAVIAEVPDVGSLSRRDYDSHKRKMLSALRRAG